MLDQDYEQAARAALQRRLDLLDDAKRRGIHTQKEYDRLRAATIKEESEVWQMPYLVQ